MRANRTAVSLRFASLTSANRRGHAPGALAATGGIFDKDQREHLANAVLVVLGAAVCAFVATSADPRPRRLFELALGLMFALAVSPQVFIALTVLAFAISTSFSAAVIPSLPVPVYFSDFVVALVAVRGVLPRNRMRRIRFFAGAPTMFFALWILVMTLAAVRAAAAGVQLQSVVRGDLPLIYWPLLLFGFDRTLRESTLDVDALWRNLGAVAIGLAGWMFLARALNHPFHDPGLALVPTGDTTFVARNFGFASAFIVYPFVALVGVAGLAQGGVHRTRWALLAAIGTIATLTTLVRGEIFSLALGIVVILVLRARQGRMSARVRTAVQLGFFAVASVTVLLVVKPDLGHAIIQRAVPLVHQAAGATENVNYRVHAVEAGYHVALAHPAGLGILDVTRLVARGIDPGFLAHSGVGTILLFGGWPALITASLAVLLVLRQSFVGPSSIEWLHAAFVGVLVMLCAYSIGAAGLAGDPWVIPLGALAVALRSRFALPSPAGNARL